MLLMLERARAEVETLHKQNSEDKGQCYFALMPQPCCIVCVCGLLTAHGWTRLCGTASITLCARSTLQSWGCFVLLALYAPHFVASPVYAETHPVAPIHSSQSSSSSFYTIMTTPSTTNIRNQSLQRDQTKSRCVEGIVYYVNDPARWRK